MINLVDRVWYVLLTSQELTELCAVRLPAIVPAWTNCVIGASLVMLGIALHMTILSYQSADAAEQKKLRELEDRHYIRFVIHRTQKANLLLIKDNI